MILLEEIFRYGTLHPQAEHAHSAASPDYAAGNFTAIGDQDFIKHFSCFNLKLRKLILKW